VALGLVRLADKSAWEQARYDKRARQRLHDLREAGQLAVCIVSMAELLYSARNADELARMRLDLSSLPYLHMSPAAEQHLVDVMAALALRGQHRTPIPTWCWPPSPMPTPPWSCTTTPTMSESRMSPGSLMSGSSRGQRGIGAITPAG
jgi:predicted nucleic acid-binding protein